MKQYFVYILANKRNGTLYIGVTSNLDKRVQEHKNNLKESFTQKYGIGNLVYFEETSDIHSALQREKNLKHWKREWKIELIELNNPDWKDLSLDSRVKPKNDTIMKESSHQTKHFTMINDSFTCENCNKEVSKHPTGSARNHCPFCLYSKHLDKVFPGDRDSECHGVMKPIGKDHKKNKGWMIEHECIKCGKKILNKLAEDDSVEVFGRL